LKKIIDIVTHVHHVQMLLIEDEPLANTVQEEGKGDTGLAMNKTLKKS